jgi:hypothetical protein
MEAKEAERAAAAARIEAAKAQHEAAVERHRAALVALGYEVTIKPAKKTPAK